MLWFVAMQNLASCYCQHSQERALFVADGTRSLAFANTERAQLAQIVPCESLYVYIPKQAKTRRGAWLKINIPNTAENAETCLAKNVDKGRQTKVDAGFVRQLDDSWQIPAIRCVMRATRETGWANPRHGFNIFPDIVDIDDLAIDSGPIEANSHINASIDLVANRRIIERQPQIFKSEAVVGIVFCSNDEFVQNQAKEVSAGVSESLARKPAKV